MITTIKFMDGSAAIDHADKIAEDVGVSRAYVLRTALYRHYGYTRAGEDVGDMYYSPATPGNPGMWILPVDTEFFWDVFEQAVLESGKIGLSAKYTDVVMAPFIQKE